LQTVMCKPCINISALCIPTNNVFYVIMYSDY